MLVYCSCLPLHAASFNAAAPAVASSIMQTPPTRCLLSVAPPVWRITAAAPSVLLPQPAPLLTLPPPIHCSRLHISALPPATPTAAPPAAHHCFVAASLPAPPAAHYRCCSACSSTLLLLHLHLTVLLPSAVSSDVRHLSPHCSLTAATPLLQRHCCNVIVAAPLHLKSLRQSIAAAPCSSSPPQLHLQLATAAAAASVPLQLITTAAPPAAHHRCYPCYCSSTAAPPAVASPLLPHLLSCS